MIRFTVTGLLLALGIGIVQTANAAGDPDNGQQLYALCGACHGPNAEGVPVLNAPANAGQDVWYMIRQLKNYRTGIRGAHPEDTFGAQMRPMAMVLVDDQAIEDVVAYIATLELPNPPRTVEGDIEAGKKYYEICTACHGDYGEGAKSLDAPRLTMQHDWYLVRQMENFKAGIRGGHQNDIYGAQMRSMSELLETEEQVRDVAAYLASLEFQPGGE